MVSRARQACPRLVGPSLLQILLGLTDGQALRHFPCRTLVDCGPALAGARLGWQFGHKLSNNICGKAQLSKSRVPACIGVDLFASLRQGIGVIG